jgi:hypothetical protein
MDSDLQRSAAAAPRRRWLQPFDIRWRVAARRIRVLRTIVLPHLIVE